MSEKILLPSAKKAVYNGTHGNTSTLIGSATLSSVGEFVLAKLDVGVQLTNAVISLEALGAGAFAQVLFVGESKTESVTASADATDALLLNSDENDWFPTSLTQEKHEVILKVWGGAPDSNSIKYRLQTVSEGNL
ncbi:hypothetical protein D0812_22145 [Vibrio owensii]|uniref:Uncharacterized protein n=1 Tax=Vibrio owensii TaxID=696485 RepID=A0AAP9KC03_9VIBR|nr:hypothetical protein [Vibrio owensii]AYO17093.1 hypothetical protein D0812_22145 [Vibrio owensii]QGH49238.1 hypothetical protein APZ19_19155 [Vibrio owensii]